MTDRHKKIAAKWCELLRELVERQYCLGGASQDEIKAATIDFLLETADRLHSTIQQDTFVPPTR